MPAKKTTKKKTPDSEWGAWVWVKWKKGAPATAWKSWGKNKNVKGAWSTSGKWDCSLWLDTCDQDEVEKFVWNTVRKSNWVDDTSTQWVKKWK